MVVWLRDLEQQVFIQEWAGDCKRDFTQKEIDPENKTCVSL